MNFDPNIDYYTVLGAAQTANRSQIVALYKAAAVKTPEIREAYRVLSNDSLRAEYDDAVDSVDFEVEDEVDDEVVKAKSNQEKAPTQNEAATGFVRKWATCLVFLVLLPVYCGLSAHFGFGQTFGSALFFAVLPIALLGTVYFLTNGQNRTRTVILVVLILGITISLIVILEAVFSPVLKGPQDIINAINNSTTGLLNIEKTLAVPVPANALEVFPTATNVSVDESELCKKAASLLRISGTTVRIIEPENWVGSTLFNVSLYWNIDGNISMLNPSQSRSFRTLKKVTLDHIDTLQNSVLTQYPCT